MIGLIMVAAALSYSNTFRVPFQFDDEAYVVNNPAIRSYRYLFSPADVETLADRSPTSMPIALRYAFATRIVGYISFAANYRLHGLDVVGYHLLNLLIHVTNGALVFLLLEATLKTERFVSPGGEGRNGLREIIPAVSSLLFVCHPIQTQAVTYISQRFTSLASLFCLLSILLYVRARLAPAGWRRAAAYCGALLGAVFAMRTKELAFTLPFVIALFEVGFFERDARERVRWLAPFAATLAIIPGLFLIQRTAWDDLDSFLRAHTAADATGISRGDYLLTQFRVIVLYLRLLVWPAGQNVDHDISVPGSPFEWQVLLSMLGLAALFCSGVLLWVVAAKTRRYPELRLASFGILWLFITLSVESSVIPLGELAAEYRMYLPSVGIIVTAVSLYAYAAARFEGVRFLRPAAARWFWAAIVVFLSLATFQRNAVWGSEISLWEDAARKSPRKVRPRQNLGTHYLLQGRLEDARRELSAAVALNPRDPELHNNLGLVHKKRGEFDLAVREFEAVLGLHPGDPIAHYNLGNLFLAKGDIAEAIREYRLALAGIPDYDEAHNNLGVAYEKTGRLDEAAREFREAVRLNPENKNARDNLRGVMRKSEADRGNR